jgi:hypothetical protein
LPLAGFRAVVFGAFGVAEFGIVLAYPNTYPPGAGHLGKPQRRITDRKNGRPSSQLRSTRKPSE